jgi:glycosyltransferase involved in cell wall biosynthesis
MIFDGLKQQLLDWNLVIVGDGEERALMEAQVDQAKLRDRVFFPGSDAATEMPFLSDDLFVCPTDSEGFALVLAEAMACHASLTTARLVRRKSFVT